MSEKRTFGEKKNLNCFIHKLTRVFYLSPKYGVHWVIFPKSLNSPYHTATTNTIGVGTIDIGTIAIGTTLLPLIPLVLVPLVLVSLVLVSLVLMPLVLVPSLLLLQQMMLVLCYHITNNR